MTRIFNAAPERLWQAWTDPEALMQWSCPKGFVVTHAEGKLEQGGGWQSAMKSSSGEIFNLKGQYKEITEPHRLVFTQQWLHRDGKLSPETTISITLKALDAKTKMTFKQSGFESDSVRDSHERGWAEAIVNLVKYLSEQTGSSPHADDTFDPELDLMLERELDVPRHHVWRALTQPQRLKKWFSPAPWTTTDCAIDLRPGGRFMTVMRSPDGEEHADEGCYLEIIENQKLVFTDALSACYRPKATGFMTVTITLDDEGAGTHYCARVSHASSDARKKHEEMGFHTGWSKALDQLVEHCKANA